MSDSFDPGELTCQDLAELITDYLEDMLSPEDRARFVAHVGICTNCSLYLEQMRATIAASGVVPVEELPASTRNSLLATFAAWQRESPG